MATFSRRGFLNRAVSSAAVTAGAKSLRAAPPKPAPPPPTPRQITEAYERADRYTEKTRVPVRNVHLAPTWLNDAEAAQKPAFWYRRDEAANAHSFVLVDASTGNPAPAFDHARLADALAKATGTPVSADHLPFSTFDFADNREAVRFAVRGQAYQCSLTDYACIKTNALPAPPPASSDDKDDETAPKTASVFFLESNNLRRRGANGSEVALTETGTHERPFAALSVSPQQKMAAVFRKTEVLIAPVFMVESSLPTGTRGVLHQHSYAQPGDKLPEWELWVCGDNSAKAVSAQAEMWTGEDAPRPLWSDGGEENGTFCIAVPDRGHQRFRVLEVTAQSGATRPLIDEKAADTGQKFINTSNTFLHLTRNGHSLFFVSERDGWRHLYRCDVADGSSHQLTRGPWVVRDGIQVDEKAKQISFWASGKNANEDPYNRHLYRVNFDGSGLTELTGGSGSHSVQFSPDKKFLVDTYSRPDMPPVHSLRRADTGAEVCFVERADVSDLAKTGWKMPEVFRAKGRDSQTDIWGIVFRPSNFDPKKRYPIIENIYAGPQDSFVRKTFGVRDGMQNLAELGFIVVQCDGMGTRNRSKAFHDVCWRNLQDAGLPDRKAWIAALAKQEPACDVSRVGIYGTSAGGQNVSSALLLHSDFYRVGVASCGCHDNRVDKRWWNEQWMGYPVGPWYEEAASVTHAGNLRGKLFLMVGELDTNVPPESTLRLADAFIKAGKDFDLLILPGQNHGSGGSYGEMRRRDYFVRHLLGANPPDRNAPAPPAPKVAPVQLTAHAAGETYLADYESGGDTSITFRNQTRQTLHLFWIANQTASPSAYGTVAPGKEKVQHTFAGHTWLVIVGEKGKGAGVLFVGDARPGIAEIKP